MMQSKVFFLLALVISLSVNSDPTNITPLENDAQLSQPGYLKNVDYLARGYNLFKGNPHQNMGDPGFSAGRIFQFAYNTHQVSSDHRFFIPDQVNAVEHIACQVNFETTEIFGESTLQKSFSQDVEASLGYLPGSFKASVSYKTQYSQTSNFKYVYTNSKAVCSVYEVSVQQYNYPQLSTEFLKALGQLKGQSYHQNPNLFNFFLDTFGTHQIQNILMGAKYGVQTKLSQSNYEILQSQNVKVSIAASYDGLWKAGINSMTEQQKQMAQKFQSKTESYEIYSIGSKPAQQVNTWVSASIETPFPLKYQILSMSDFLEQYWRQRGQYTAVNVAIVANVKLALGSYCAYLASHGLVLNCSPPQPDKKITNQCRMCENGCGSRFPNQGGSIIDDQNWPVWMVQFRQGCSDNSYGNQAVGKSSLCCQEESQHYLGQCRFCLSCGGSYNHYGGKLSVDQNWPDWQSIYDNQCNGSQTHRRVNGGFSLCCNQPICVLCVTCGNGYLDEVGAYSHDQDWPTFFTELGENCSGGFGNHDYAYKDGIRLCCRPRTII